MQRGKWKKSWLIIDFCSFVLIGVYSAKYSVFVPVSFAALAVVILIVSFKLPLLSLVGWAIIGLFLGNIQGVNLKNQLAWYVENKDKKVVIIATIKDNPVFHKSKQSEFIAYNIYSHRDIPGEIKIRSYDRNLKRGQNVQIEGKLREGFGSRLGFIYYAQVTVLQNDNSLTSTARESFINNIYTNMNDPQASLGLGFLIGVRSLLPDELESQLSITGLTHIVAISGYNLTILVKLVRRSLGGLSRFMTLSLTFGFLGTFLLIAGSSPSLIRASIVSVLSLLAWYYGRKFIPMVILLLSAAISAFMQPIYIWYDLGWYLSFMAFFGILVLAPALSARIKSKRFYSLKQLTLETFSAQLMTYPLIVLTFGTFSVVSMLANLLVLPVIPIAMLATFVGGISMWLPFEIASWLMLPAEFILSYIISVIQNLASFSFSSIELTINQAQFAAIILLIMSYTMLISINKKSDTDTVS